MYDLPQAGLERSTSRTRCLDQEVHAEFGTAPVVPIASSTPAIVSNVSVAAAAATSASVSKFVEPHCRTKGDLWFCW